MTETARRGQLVLLAAAAIALALVPLTVAYLQLGYAGDVGAAELDESPVRNGERLLDRGLHGAVEGIPEEYPWSNRSAAVTAVTSRLGSDIATLEGVAVESGTVYNVTYNDSRAAAWKSDNCPSGPDRQFGGCAVLEGVVVQERAGETHVLAAAFDIEITTAEGQWRATTVVRVGRDA